MRKYRGSNPLFQDIPGNIGAFPASSGSTSQVNNLIVAKYGHGWSGEFLTNVNSTVFVYGSNRGPHTSNPIFNGWRAPSLYGRTTRSIVYKPCDCIWVSNLHADPAWDYPQDYEHQYGAWPGSITSLGFTDAQLFGDFSLIDFPNNRNKAINALYNNFNNDRADWGTNIVEAEKSVSDLGNLTSTLLKSFRALRARNPSMLADALGHGTPKTVSDVSRKVADRWLQYIYGVQPLMQDIHSTYTESQKRIQKDMLMSFKGSSTVSFTRPLVFSDYLYKQTTSQQSWFKVYVNITSPEVIRASQFGLLNPLSVAWETVPFSFLIDWTVPIGSFLSALSAPLGYELATGSEVTRSHSTTNITWFRDVGTSYVVLHSGTPFGCDIDNNVYNRLLVTSFPLPGLFVKSPFSTPHVANALALIASAKR